MPVHEGAASAAVAVVQVGALNPRAGLVAADVALRATASVGKAASQARTHPNDDRGTHQAVTIDTVARAVALYRGVRVISRFRRVLDQADARAESPGESRPRYDLLLSGDEVDLQFDIRTEGHVHRVDMPVEGRNVLIENDGDGTYTARGTSIGRAVTSTVSARSG